MSVDDSGPENRLASYGSLAPGKVNHHELAGPRGRWQPGTVRGRLIDGGWGAGLGFPALIPDSDGPEVEVQLFESPDLPDHWARLDEFEGSEYRRVIAVVRTVEGELSAYLYAAASE